MEIKTGVKSGRPTAAVHNLGCKANAYESEAMAGMLRDAGYTIVPFQEKADVYVVNTCTVTNIADRKSRQMLHRARRLNPDALIVAVGCYVQTHREQLEEDADVDLLIGTNCKSQLVEMIRQASGASCITDVSAPSAYENLPAYPVQDRCRAVLKIQDGCNQFCSYCAIPLARGRVRSRDPKEVLAEAGMLAGKGYKEIVLTGIHLCSYGLDFPAQKSSPEKPMQALIGLIGELSDIPGIVRIRLGSLEPGSMTDDVIRQLAGIPAVCPHFHLSLQSGCDATLKRMNRRYTADEFRHVCDCLRACYKDPTLTTDVIVGFPGEDEEEFKETYRFLEEIRFYHTHIFKYSRRDGTRAASMPGQVPEAVKTERARVLGELDRQMKEMYRGLYEGRSAEVLIEEKREDGLWTGHTAGYLKAAMTGDNLKSNELAAGTIGKEIRLID